MTKKRKMTYNFYTYKTLENIDKFNPKMSKTIIMQPSLNIQLEQKFSLAFLAPHNGFS